MSKKPIETVSVVPVVTVDNIGEDIISNLPDNIISHILSLLPAKDALRTCVLSKEWEYKWTCIYNVDIDETRRFSRKRARQKSAVNFIDRILLLAPIPTIKTFRLTCLYKYSPSRLLTWLTAVLMRNAEHVEINYDREGVVLPRCLFHCTSLMILKLQLPCTLRLPPDNWFSNIKILHLARVQFINERVSNTPTFDFPVMERLQLDNCKWFKVNMVEIKAPALTKFNVSHHSGLPKGERCRIKMSGAKHLRFDVYGHFVENFDLSASSVFSLVVNCPLHANDFQVVQKDGLSARLLLNRCFGLKHLKLAGNVVEGIVVTKQGPPLPEFDMLKRLELFNKCKIGSLLEILHAMPLLETIIFEMLQWDDDIYDEVESLPSCITHHLSSVQFRLFNGKKEHVHMADFWLTNAVGLKKMLGLSRKRSEESQSEENFWTKLKSVFKDGNLMVGSSIKNMADFERFFG
ncbi:F-box/LRR-repeat protein At4g14103-like isoform X1 [Henckelia pumila]|uniref:F-box/LRR-repeat protein At4g14103-like isoform X1 n=1 Tax=Henckelia pumila TaxID=405737 RepID=UPI003C6DF12C